MCGILYTNDPRVTTERFREALGWLRHRGPDAEGYLRVGAAQLGHTRLKILDLDDRSNQPFVTRDGRYALIYNGEIYNYRELARASGLQPRTTGDTEVLAELLAQEGAACLRRVNGMFAFVFLDVESGETLLARDRLGIKPLYVRRFEGSLSVCSELAPLARLFGDRKVDEVGLRQYRKLRSFFNGRTALAHIQQLGAGSFIQGSLTRRYWELPTGRQLPPRDEELQTLIEEAVRRRLLADVEVGTYLSGGLDSSLITALAKPKHSWTVGFAGHNEFSWGRQVADRCGTIHHEVLVDGRTFRATARDMVLRRMEPLSVPNEVLLYLMTQEVRRCNTVVLSGEGADELFFGYDRIFRWAASSSRWNLEGFARRYSYGSVADLEIVEDALEPFMSRGEPIEIVAAFFQVAHLHGLLRRLDNATMECGVEARVPFVDHQLVERMAGVSFDYRMEGGSVKAPLKRLSRGLLPAAVIEREKVGFPVPLEELGFVAGQDGTAMDGWLEFNLSALAEVLGDEAMSAGLQLSKGR